MLTNEQKNQWLAENVFRECWHEWYLKIGIGWFCSKCPYGIEHSDDIPNNPDFYSSNEDEQAINFFRLWRVIEKRKDFWLIIAKLLDMCSIDIEYEGEAVLPIRFINCSALADAIGEYFGWKEGK